MTNPTVIAGPSVHVQWRDRTIVTSPNDSEFQVTCPYCGETVEIYLEPDTSGAFIQDCEVCCNPWQLRVMTEGSGRYLEVSRADGSE